MKNKQLPLDGFNDSQIESILAQVYFFSPKLARNKTFDIVCKPWFKQFRWQKWCWRTWGKGLFGHGTTSSFQSISWNWSVKNHKLTLNFGIDTFEFSMIFLEFSRDFEIHKNTIRQWNWSHRVIGESLTNPLITYLGRSGNITDPQSGSKYVIWSRE